MPLYKLIPDLWVFKVDLPSNIEVSQYTMNLFELIFSCYSSISTIIITDDLNFIISTIFLQHLLISILDESLVSWCNADELDHFMDHSRPLTSLLKICIKNYRYIFYSNQSRVHSRQPRDTS